MATDQVVVDSESVGTKATRREARPQPRGGPRWGLLLFILVIVGGAGAGWYFVFAEKDRGRPAEHGSIAGHGKDKKANAGSGLPRLEVAKPKRGGMEMTTNQPGTVHAFDFAQLYARVSGYVKPDGLKVDRGSRVKKDELMVALDAPEFVAAVVAARASLVRTRAHVDMAKAHVKTAEEMVNARIANEQESVAKLQAATSVREYREKQYLRIEDLVKRGSVEQRLLDEEEDRRGAARSSEYAAKAGVLTAKAQVAEARAELAQAKADLEGADADVQVAQAVLDEKMTWESYTRIKAPYAGVVIFRGEAVHPGAFIQSADKGVGEPMLTVARDDVMRTIIPVPDRDVPFCDVGDPAIVHVNALNDREFKGVVSRIAESEDVNDRTMRVEVNLPNRSPHVLRDGMYGRAVIILQKATPHLTVPSSAVLDRDSEGKGTIEVVRDGKLYRQPVVIGRDTGTLAEIVSGLDPDAQVVTTPDVSMADGTPVEAESATVAEAPGSTKAAHS